MNPPDFSDDASVNVSAQGFGDSLKWDNRDGKTVLLDYQEPVRSVTENGAYLMRKDLLESLPDHIGQFWIVDTEDEVLRRFPRSRWQDIVSRRTIEDDDVVRFAVDVSHAEEEYSLDEVDL